MALIDVDVFREALNDYIVAENCDGDYKDGLIEAGLMALDLPKFELPTWISCAERLPNHGEIVICDTLYFTEVLQWDARSEVWIGKSSIHGKEYVTHWMPLPQPPKGDE